MSSTKNRDLAQELVDFLLKEEKTKDQSKAKDGDKKNEGAVSELHATALNPSSMEMNTFAIATGVPVEFDLDLGDGAQPDVDFTTSHQNSTHALKAGPKENPSEKSLPLESVKPEMKSSSTTLPQSQAKSQNAGKNFDKVSNSPRSKVIFSEVNNLLGGVGAVQAAQQRITSLEDERDALRSETDSLLAACESLQKKYSETQAESEKASRRHREKLEILEEEKTVMKTRLAAKEHELIEIKRSHDELKERFQNDLRKVRVRERDLENRQELLKAESVAVTNSKDEMILELKRQLELLQTEIDGFRAQSADLHSTINEFYERNHRTVKALRLALSILEVADSPDRAEKAAS
jgi:DNA repair exonuclease SbcCD ATPase subunit